MISTIVKLQYLDGRRDWDQETDSRYSDKDESQMPSSINDIPVVLEESSIGIKSDSSDTIEI